jgi:hypothetical protein
MLEKRGEEWKGKARIIGLSIDKDMPTLSNHLQAKGWTAPEHFLRSDSDASQVYGVRGVPHVMLVDKQGVIVFKGHPASRPNLEQDIDDLIAGKSLTGAGVWSGELGEEKKEEENEENSGKELDGEKINSEIDGFVEIQKKVMESEELKKAAESLIRAFNVFVFEQTLVPNTGKTTSEYNNYRVLMGKQEGIDSVKQILADNFTGSFEVELQEREM